MSQAAAALADALRDRYALDRELGRGGMATVYLARDLKHDRLVALKVILQGALAFVRHIDAAAACMYALQHEVLAALGIRTQGFGRQAYRT